MLYRKRFAFNDCSTSYTNHNTNSHNTNNTTNTYNHRNNNNNNWNTAADSSTLVKCSYLPHSSIVNTQYVCVKIRSLHCCLGNGNSMDDHSIYENNNNNHDDSTKSSLGCWPPWWPSNNTIRRERRLQGYRSDEDEDEEKSVKIASLPSLPPSMHGRLSNHIEPGILEKLPHCKIHQARVELQKNHPNPGPLFCSQVTEAYCTEVMLCCSICHTWRHTACGGHYTKYKPHTSKDSNN